MRILPLDIDRECIFLCEALNQIPGIRTLSSCCGHGKTSFHIWFTATKVRYLTIIGRVFDRRYGGLVGWECFLSNNDTPEDCPVFLIDSKEIVGDQAYEDSKRIAKNILNHLSHKNFRKEFNL